MPSVKYFDQFEVTPAWYELAVQVFETMIEGVSNSSEYNNGQSKRIIKQTFLSQFQADSSELERSRIVTIVAIIEAMKTPKKLALSYYDNLNGIGNILANVTLIKSVSCMLDKMYMHGSHHSSINKYIYAVNCQYYRYYLHLADNSVKIQSFFLSKFAVLARSSQLQMPQTGFFATQLPKCPVPCTCVLSPVCNTNTTASSSTAAPKAPIVVDGTGGTRASVGNTCNTGNINIGRMRSNPVTMRSQIEQLESYKQATLDKRYLITKDGLFRCIMCDKLINTRAGMRSHSNIHLGVKNYKCQYCGRRFSGKTSCDRHERIHTGVKPFECTVCLKKFRIKSSLTSHLDTHAEHKQYHCDVDGCGKYFSHKSSLRRHARNLHPLMRSQTG